MDCSICFERFDDEIISNRPYLINPCGHCFCSSCLNDLSLQTCPICRVNIESKICNWQLIELITESKSKSKLKEEILNSVDNIDLFVSFQWDLKDQIKEFQEKLNIYCCHYNTEIRMYRNEDKADPSNNSALNEKTLKIIKSSKLFVCFLTNKFIKSINCVKELTFAHSIGKRILPIYIENIDTNQIHLISIYLNDKINCFDQNHSGNNWLNEYFDLIIKKITDILKVILILSNFCYLFINLIINYRKSMKLKILMILWFMEDLKC